MTGTGQVVLLLDYKKQARSQEKLLPLRGHGFAAAHMGRAERHVRELAVLSQRRHDVRSRHGH